MMGQREADEATDVSGIVPIIQNYRYGEHPRHQLDVYAVPSTQPTPVVVFFHGGGFIKSDKESIAVNYAYLLKECLDNGISVVSANYRYITECPFPAPMDDGARVIQTVRSQACAWNINPLKIASAGGSAGANIALWNAMKGDRSRRDAADPISRFSTAVNAVITFNGQISKDPRFYQTIHTDHDMQTNILDFFGVSSKEELELPQIRQLAMESHTLDMVGCDSPPVMAVFTEPYRFTPVPLPAEAPNGIVVHHPIHGFLLSQKMKKFGRSCIFRHPDNPVRQGEYARFLLEAWEDCNSIP
jgi:acetyl esterase